MAKAIEKLARMEEALRGLGGKDCGRCGAPACTATAEDIVLGRVSDTACVHRSARQEGTK
jgi:Na+-translocating ferredoxin:NAD+ oxidoreductase RNF subunit RnfB